MAIARNVEESRKETQVGPPCTGHLAVEQRFVTVKRYEIDLCAEQHGQIGTKRELLSQRDRA